MGNAFAVSWPKDPTDYGHVAATVVQKGRMNDPWLGMGHYWAGGDNIQST